MLCMHVCVCTRVQVLLRWGLQSGYIVIPKSSRPERLAENASVVGPAAFTLTPADMAALDALDEHCVVGWNCMDTP